MEEKVNAWKGVAVLKNGLVNNIVTEIGERTLDVSDDNVKVFAIEHHCNEGLWGTLCTMSADGFTMGEDADNIDLCWRDMIVEDLGMVLDYLRTGYW